MGVRFTRRGQGQGAERHGKKFQSVTEADFYSALLRMGIQFSFQVEHILQEPVKQNTAIPLISAHGVHKIKVTTDFEFTREGIHYIIDTKGAKEYATQRSVMAYHLLKGKLYREGKGENTVILMIDRKEVLALSKLSGPPDKTYFWKRFNELKPF